MERKDEQKKKSGTYKAMELGSAPSANLASASASILSNALANVMNWENEPIVDNVVHACYFHMNSIT